VHTLVNSEIVVKTVLRLVLRLLMACVALAGILAALAGYLLYTPNPKLPRLSGTVTAGSIVIDGESERTKPMFPRDWRRERRWF
jgi:polyhydroxybutyrate depolymerase